MVVIDPVFTLVARAAIVALFAHSAWSKFTHFRRFRATLAEYRVLPEVLVHAAARSVAAVEVVIIVACIVPASASAGMAAAAMLLTLYLAAIGVNLARGRRDIDCGCTGPALRQTLSEWLVARNIALIALAVAGALPPATRSLGIGDAVLAAGGLAMGIVLYSALNQLAANQPRLDALDAFMDSV